MEQILKETMPAGIDFEWTDLTYQQILAGNSSIVVFPPCAAARLSRSGRASMKA